MRTGDITYKTIGFCLITGFVHSAAIPDYEVTDTRPSKDAPRIANELVGRDPTKRKLLKRAPAPQRLYTPGGSNDNTLENIDPQGDRRANDQDEDDTSNGPWDMFGNVSPGTLGDLRTHIDLVQDQAPQNTGLGLGLQLLRNPANNAAGGNAVQGGPQGNDSDTEIEEEEEKEATEFEEEEKETTELEERERGVSENLEDIVESSHRSEYESSTGGQRFFITQPPENLFPELQPSPGSLNRRPSLLSSLSINSRIAAESNGARSRSSPPRVGQRVSGMFGNFDPSTFRDEPVINRNRRQSFSSPSDLLDFGGHSLLSRLGSAEGQFIRPASFNSGHGSPYPQTAREVTEALARESMREVDLFNQVLSNEALPPRTLANQLPPSGQSSRGIRQVDVTGGLGEQRVYREQEEEGKEDSDVNSMQDENA
ncbi:hypothetical protein TWF281_000997 [Arthrobotrys megalospora]